MKTQAARPPAGRRATARMPLRRRLEFVALLATVPAFYLALLASHRALAVSLYLVGSFVSAAIAWGDVRRPGSSVSARRARSRGQLGALIALALLLSALLPGGDAPGPLTVRLAAAALILLRWGEAVVPSAWRGGLAHVLGLGIVVFVLCGLGFWWLEPHARSLDDGLWLAFTTAATVGYGDIVPSTAASRIFAVFVVLLGLAVLSLVTAAIAARFVQTEERRIEQEMLQELHLELRGIRSELSAWRRENGRTVADATVVRLDV